MSYTQSITTRTGQENLISINKLDNDAYLRKMLIDIAYILGVKEPPMPEILTQMIEVLKDQFSDLSISEINKAVKLALGGQLNMNFNTYNNFSIPYICNILIKYREYKSHQPKEFQEHQSYVSPEKKAEIHKEWLEKALWGQIDRYMKTGEKVMDINSLIYNYLNRHGFIKFTPEREARILKQAKEEFVYRNRRGKITNIDEIISSLHGGNRDVDGMIELIKNRISLQAFLTDCSDVGRDIVHELKQVEKIF